MFRTFGMGKRVTVGDNARVGVNVLNNALWSVYALLIEVGKEVGSTKVPAAMPEHAIAFM